MSVLLCLFDLQYKHNRMIVKMDKDIMPSLNDDYLTPEIARQNGVSKYKFYRFVHEE